MINVYEVWVEGFNVTGNNGRAQFLGSFPGNDFKDACRRALIANEWETKGYYDRVRNTYWGCRFYDNEMDARKSFG